MQKAVSKEWKSYKAKLKENIEKAIERNNVDKETLEMMLGMLEHSKLKPRRYKNHG